MIYFMITLVIKHLVIWSHGVDHGGRIAGFNGLTNTTGTTETGQTMAQKPLGNKVDGKLNLPNCCYLVEGIWKMKAQKTPRIS